MKLADAVTCDDHEDVIPLSERFDKGNEDIRYSLRETDDGRKVAVVDNDILQDIYDGRWTREKEKQAKAAARNALKKFSRVYVNNVETAVNSDTRREFGGSRYSKALWDRNKKAFADKMRFADVMDENAWYYDAVYAAWDAGLMNGVGEGLFAPNATLDRATLATVLYREAGESAAKGTASFTDIAEGQWYTDAVNWAAEQGVVNGYPDGTFRPEAPITRQEMATMLYRYWKLRGGKYTAKDDVLAGYQDRCEVADWALEAMSWTVQSGIIVGMTPTTLNPAGSATRAQVALVLVNYLKMN